MNVRDAIICGMITITLFLQIGILVKLSSMDKKIDQIQEYAQQASLNTNSALLHIKHGNI